MGLHVHLSTSCWDFCLAWSFEDPMHVVITIMRSCVQLPCVSWRRNISLWLSMACGSCGLSFWPLFHRGPLILGRRVCDTDALLTAQPLILCTLPVAVSILVITSCKHKCFWWGLRSALTYGNNSKSLEGQHNLNWVEREKTLEVGWIEKRGWI